MENEIKSTKLKMKGEIIVNSLQNMGRNMSGLFMTYCEVYDIPIHKVTARTVHLDLSRLTPIQQDKLEYFVEYFLNAQVSKLMDCD